MPSPNIAPVPPTADACLDLAHLARQTGDDLSLQHELLALFKLRSTDLLAAIHALAEIYALAESPAQYATQIRNLAHQLRGAALAIGAFETAAAAAALEDCLERPETDPKSALARLGAAQVDALTRIDLYLIRTA